MKTGYEITCLYRHGTIECDRCQKGVNSIAFGTQRNSVGQSFLF